MKEAVNIQPEPEYLLNLEGPDCQELRCLLKRETVYLSSVSGIVLDKRSLRQGKWRPKIFEWFYKIIDHFGFDRDIVAIAMDLLDRYQVFHTEEIDGELYQLAAMASLYVSIKINFSSMSQSGGDSGRRRIFSLHEYAALSRGQFSADDLTKMELDLLGTLRWKLNPVIPTNFLVSFLRLFPCGGNKLVATSSEPFGRHPSDEISYKQFVLTVIYEVTRYLIEVSITSSDASFYLNFRSNSRNQRVSPSSVCFSALLITIDLISEDYLPFESREVFLKRANTILQIEPQDVIHIKNVIFQSFIPALVLKGSLSEEQTYEEIRKLHPIEILRDANILCIESEYALVNSFVKEHRDSKRKHPPSPTSLLEQEYVHCRRRKSGPTIECL